MSGKVSVVSDHAAIEGRYLDFYLGEWANDSALVCGTLSKMSLTLIYIRQSLVAQGTSLKHLKWQVLILCNTVLLIHQEKPPALARDNFNKLARIF